MIKVTVGTNTERKPVLTEVNVTLKKTLQDNNVNTAKATVLLNGTQVSEAELNKTFEQFGIVDGSEPMLIAVIKADSAR